MGSLLFVLRVEVLLQPKISACLVLIEKLRGGTLVVEVFLVRNIGSSKLAARADNGG